MVIPTIFTQALWGVLWQHLFDKPVQRRKDPIPPRGAGQGRKVLFRPYRSEYQLYPGLHQKRASQAKDERAEDKEKIAPYLQPDYLRRCSERFATFFQKERYHQPFLQSSPLQRLFNRHITVLQKHRPIPKETS
jgi:hypothetical protein